MRLSDARAAGLSVLGVIRGVGLSNDGRGAGLISPAEEGQVRAMRLAYEAAGVAPGTVSLVECHATGTPVGDAVEARGMAQVFGAGADVPIGSVKSNVGHLLASAGVAGLLKVLGALRAGVRPATLGAELPLDALAGTPLRVLTAPEPWSGPRRAAVSAFGFGGTNAHLVVDHPDDGLVSAVPRPSRPVAAVTAPIGAREAPGGRTPVAIVALGARVGDGTCTEDFRRAVLGGERRGPATGIAVELTDLCFPPVALERTVRHQLLVLEAAREAVRSVSLPRERTMVVVGMGVDPEVARAGARWRVPHWLEQAGLGTTPESAELARDAFVPPMTAEGVVGTLPNLVANRISTQLDLAGPGFAVSAEEASGLVALELAARAVRSGRSTPRSSVPPTCPARRCIGAPCGISATRANRGTPPSSWSSSPWRRRAGTVTRSSPCWTTSRPTSPPPYPTWSSETYATPCSTPRRPSGARTPRTGWSASPSRRSPSSTARCPGRVSPPTPRPSYTPRRSR